jgi:hypothetical protein
LIFRLYHGSLPWTAGGEYLAFYRLVRRLLAAWKGVGLDLLFVFDGTSSLYPSILPSLLLIENTWKINPEQLENRLINRRTTTRKTYDDSIPLQRKYNFNPIILRYLPTLSFPTIILQKLSQQQFNPPSILFTCLYPSSTRYKYKSPLCSPWRSGWSLCCLG